MAMATNPAASRPRSSFLSHCVFVSIDFQESARGYLSEESMPGTWREMGFSVADCNAAVDYLHDTALPNARRVADACRALHLPMIFVHWGYQFRDAMDLAPDVYQAFTRDIGSDVTKWPHHISAPDSRVAAALGVRPGEYVLAKTDQDAFGSCNIAFVLRNLGARSIVFVGGHTEGCLGRSARSARRLGFKTLCIADATFNARESARLRAIEESRFDYAMLTDEFTAWTERVTRR
jgi:nicotinamidase-related amidase